MTDKCTWNIYGPTRVIRCANGEAALREVPTRLRLCVPRALPAVQKVPRRKQSWGVSAHACSREQRGCEQALLSQLAELSVDDGWGEQAARPAGGAGASRRRAAEPGPPIHDPRCARPHRHTPRRRQQIVASGGRWAARGLDGAGGRAGKELWRRRLGAWSVPLPDGGGIAAGGRRVRGGHL